MIDSTTGVYTVRCPKGAYVILDKNQRQLKVPRYIIVGMLHTLEGVPGPLLKYKDIELACNELSPISANAVRSILLRAAIFRCCDPQDDVDEVFDCVDGATLMLCISALPYSLSFSSDNLETTIDDLEEPTTPVSVSAGGSIQNVTPGATRVRALVAPDWLKLIETPQDLREAIDWAKGLVYSNDQYIRNAGGSIVDRWGRSLVKGVIVLTRDMVNYLLSINTDNRPLRSDRVIMRSKEILADGWNDFMDIGVGVDGLLGNGQHRLKALSLLQSNPQYPFYYPENSPKAGLSILFDRTWAMAKIDNATPRRFSDTVNILNKKIKPAHIAAIRLYALASQGRRLTEIEAVKEFENNSWEQFFQDCGYANIPYIGDKTRSVTAALRAAFRSLWEVDPELATRLCRDVCSCTGSLVKTYNAEYTRGVVRAISEGTRRANKTSVDHYQEYLAIFQAELNGVKAKNGARVKYLSKPVSLPPEV